jgi:hypothetical protein
MTDEKKAPNISIVEVEEKEKIKDDNMVEFTIKKPEEPEVFETDSDVVDEYGFGFITFATDNEAVAKAMGRKGAKVTPLPPGNDFKIEIPLDPETISELPKIVDITDKKTKTKSVLDLAKSGLAKAGVNPIERMKNPFETMVKEMAEKEMNELDDEELDDEPDVDGEELEVEEVEEPEPDDYTKAVTIMEKEATGEKLSKEDIEFKERAELAMKNFAKELNGTASPRKKRE